MGRPHPGTTRLRGAGGLDNAPNNGRYLPKLAIRGRADYTTPLAPDLSFELEETATFEGDRIRHLEDRYDDATRERMRAYLEAYAEGLGLDL